MRLASLGSGSKGNATLIAAGSTLVMIDCGFSLKETRRRMQRLGVAPEQLDAILVTHEHSDHSAGVAVLSRNASVPVYLTHGTASTGRIQSCHETVRFNAGDTFIIGDLSIQAIAVPHDAREPCQYRVSYGDLCWGVLTDLGSITPHVIQSYSQCQGLMLEFNHDVDMLQAGEYPPALKRRVGGDWGHLNNHQAVQFLSAVGTEGLRHLVMAHVSENNNCLDRARSALSAVIDPTDERVIFADQGDGLEWLSLA
ncbi:MBL fold metallo-hydrolase [Halioglobus pacificus]|uniref:MBL fold metallo-hydrolase n=1 Tax=Parahalioglobus pacificus TaxID=930806 RepID=A0A918XHQ6_9GAMM|nr:MBL fold metallo-hydrolase [Halioglobus pacificus]GHD32504.1 MBL fold metallo-hydrolase [Halioglobus pacificus]